MHSAQSPLYRVSANPIAEKTETIVRGCEVVGGTVKSGWKFHARGARTKIQQAILDADITRSRMRTPFLHVIEILPGHSSGRVVAYCKPRLSAMRLVHIIWRA